MSLTFNEQEVEKLEQLRDRMVMWSASRGQVSGGLIYESYQEFEILLREARERREQEQVTADENGPS